MQEAKERTTRGNNVSTIKGAWKLVRRTAEANGIKVGLPSLKQYARGQAARTDVSPVVKDARRWLEAKRPGGTDEERQARREKRKEQRGIRASSAAAKKGKGSLKPSGKGSRES